MTNKKWQPVTGIFYCPGKMSISADELGITIGVGNRALATTEWPNENIRLCEAVEEPTITITPERRAALAFILKHVDLGHDQYSPELQTVNEMLREMGVANDTPE